MPTNPYSITIYDYRSYGCYKASGTENKKKFTVWKFRNFSATQILREINCRGSWRSWTVMFAILQGVSVRLSGHIIEFLWQYHCIFGPVMTMQSSVGSNQLCKIKKWPMASIIFELYQFLWKQSETGCAP